MPKNLKLIALALVARASILVLIFAVASVALAKLFSLVPDFGKLSPWVTLGLPLALAWLVTAGLGANIAQKKHALDFATSR
ncbi:MAG: hypothetical protein QMD00_02155, partial [Hadesarchaea archaeon]|nr:hypothetical protein [Hadesarchaea archaeon]